MKKTIFTIMLLAFSVYSQSTGWSSIKSTSINLTNAISADIFTNGSGNHIIVQESNSLKYYNVDVNGNTINSVMLENNTSVVTPSITGDATRLYVVYRKSSESFIRTNFSSNGGSTWSYLSSLNYNANSIETVFSNNKLHITFEGSNLIYHSQYDGQLWSNPFQVSTDGNGYGGRINALHDNDEDKIYVVYKNLSGHIGKWREYNVATGNWSSVWQAYNIPGNVNASAPTGFKIDESSICIYYFYYAQDISGAWLYYNTWVVKNRSNGAQISNGGMDIYSPKSVHSTRTSDGISHASFYYTELLEDVPTVGIWRSNLSSGYPYDLIVGTIYSGEPNHINISSASNDVYVIWKEGSSSNLKLRYYDAVPLAPTNVSVTASPQNKPLISWSANNEPDRSFYKVYKKSSEEFGWQYLGTTSGTSYTDNSETIVTGPPVANEHLVYYRVTCVDLTTHESPASNSVSIRVYGPPLEKANGGSVSEVTEYLLLQNYPNPFNPKTTIKFNIPNVETLRATSLRVSLKIYDLIGNEVAILADEEKSAGEYEVEFNGGNLSSGIYYYTLRAGSFVETKKLILMK